MSELQNRLKLLQPHLVQLRFPEGTPVVDMVFTKGWHVPTSEVIQSTKGDSEEVNYHMFYSVEDGIGLDEILDYIEKVIGLNIEREKKHALLKVKAKELQDLFRKNPLSKLEGMRFQLGGEQLVQEMTPDPLDVVDFNIETPIIETPTPQPVTQPQPEPVAQPQPQPVAQPQPEAQPQPAVQQPVNEENVRRAPNGEIIPPLEPEDKGELDEDFQKFDLTAKEPTVTKNVGGRNIDLPKKKEPSIKLDEIEGPQNVVCKCGPDDVCPACEEQKIGTY
jgi:hypothetical protein